MSHRPGCVKCGVELYPKENGVGVLDTLRGVGFQLWDADLWECPVCGYQIVTGFGQEPVAEKYQSERFQTFLNNYTANRTVIDCERGK